MRELIEHVEQLSGVILGADAGDLTGLADAHSRLEKVSQLISEMPGDAASSLSQAATISVDARKKLEKLILNEYTDADAELKGVTKTIGDLQRLVEAAMNGTVAEIAPAPQAATAVAVVQETEHAQVNVSAVQLNPDDVPLIGEFVTEATGHLEQAEQDLLKLEEDPGDTDTISSLFRSFHTIKGVAGFLNLNVIQSLAHAAENLLDKARQGAIRITGRASELVLESIDKMKALVSGLDAAAKSGNPFVPADGVTGLVVRLEDFVAEAAKDPAVAAGEVDAPPAQPVPAKAQETAIADSEHASPEAQAAKSSPSGDNTVKVATDRLDSLINMVGELVIAQSMVVQDTTSIVAGNQRLGRNMAHLGKITRELQDLSMSLRMVPIDNVFRKMNRLVRDVARKMGKEIELVLTGKDTELDRNVVEALADPLVHMVRNCVDHGIELPEERERVGKSRVGRIELKAYHQGGSINIEIIDDGKGLRKDKILKKAIENGLVQPGQAISDQEIYQLIFAAGLSTAEKVTDISGRGVGMDVVRQNMERLRGRTDIATVEGKGTTFTIRLPLTLAVIDGLIVKVGASKYVLPILSIEQSLRPKTEQLSTVQNRGELCMVRGQLLPLLRLHRLFNVEAKTEDPTQALVVIVQDNDRRVCILVDELLGQEQVVIKSLGDGIDKVPGISGGAVLGDGNVSLILDVPGLIELATEHS